MQYKTYCISRNIHWDFSQRKKKEREAQVAPHLTYRSLADSQLSSGNLWRPCSRMRNHILLRWFPSTFLCYVVSVTFVFCGACLSRYVAECDANFQRLSKWKFWSLLNPAGNKAAQRQFGISEKCFISNAFDRTDNDALREVESQKQSSSNESGDSSDEWDLCRSYALFSYENSHADWSLDDG